MNLIEAYVYEVTRRLPEKTRDDIAMELRSTIEDMLPESPTEGEVKEALSTLGDPSILASRYSEKPMYLIGPKVYDAYISTMKKIVPWAILITVLANVITVIVSYSGDESVLQTIIDSFSSIIVNTVLMLIQLFFWLTIVFAFIDRVGLSKTDLPITKMGVPWTPEDLKLVEVIPKKKVIPKGEIIFGLIWTAIWGIAYFNADHLVGLYRNENGEGLQFIMPLFHQDVLLSYWPLIVITFLLEIGLAVCKWNTKIWTVKIVSINAIIRLFGLVVFIIIASNTSLLNGTVIPYMSDIFDSAVSSVEYFMKWTWWIIVASVVVTTLIEIYDSFRKSKIVS